MYSYVVYINIFLIEFVLLFFFLFGVTDSNIIFTYTKEFLIAAYIKISVNVIDFKFQINKFYYSHWYMYTRSNGNYF